VPKALLALRTWVGSPATAKAAFDISRCRFFILLQPNLEISIPAGHWLQLPA
jgi:hypothetical protein